MPLSKRMPAPKLSQAEYPARHAKEKRLQWTIENLSGCVRRKIDGSNARFILDADVRWAMSEASVLLREHVAAHGRKYRGGACKPKPGSLRTSVVFKFQWSFLPIF